MAVSQSPIYAEVYDFLTSAPSPQAIVTFKPSVTMQSRVSELLELNRAGRLTADDRAELDEFERLNHFMSMLKIHARKKLLEK
ncbi:MAG: hypothetical protein RLP44_21235 [Aggregatilineales bacterium]